VCHVCTKGCPHAAKNLSRPHVMDQVPVAAASSDSRCAIACLALRDRRRSLLKPHITTCISIRLIFLTSLIQSCQMSSLARVGGVTRVPHLHQWLSTCCQKPITPSCDASGVALRDCRRSLLKPHINTCIFHYSFNIHR